MLKRKLSGTCRTLRCAPEHHQKLASAQPDQAEGVSDQMTIGLAEPDPRDIATAGEYVSRHIATCGA